MRTSAGSVEARSVSTSTGMRARPMTASPNCLSRSGRLGLRQRGRPQLQKQRAHLGQGSSGQLPQLLQPLPALLGVALVDAGQDLGDEADREEGLADGVVQVAGQALPLPAGGQLVGVLVEAGVLDGDGQLVGQGLGGEHVLLVERVRLRGR